jgi:hypothetical protein
MATAVIIKDQKVKTKRVFLKRFLSSKVLNNFSTVAIYNKDNANATIYEKDFSIFNVVHTMRTVVINETVPFRVKFTNIGVEGYGPNNVPGIGIQVIGYSNYIL